MSNWKRFEKLKLEEVIRLCQDEKSSLDVSNDAYLAICFRCRLDLLKKCEFLCKRLGHDVDVAYLIVENTLKKYAKSKNYRVDLGKHENVEVSFKFYLYKIAKNELRDYYKREQKKIKGQLYTGDETIITRLPDVNPEDLDIKSRIIHETLLKLPYSHQVIYLTYKMHEKEGVNLPRKLQKELREHLNNIKQPTVRTYKKEAYDQIENAKNIITTLMNENEN